MKLAILFFLLIFITSHTTAGTSQNGSFAEENNAERHKENLKLKNPEIGFKKVEINISGRIYFRVMANAPCKKIIDVSNVGCFDRTKK